MSLETYTPNNDSLVNIASVSFDIDKDTELYLNTFYNTTSVYRLDFIYDSTIVSNVIGDANGDRRADIIDVIMINQAVLGKEKLKDDLIKNIDSNKNGITDSIDSLNLLKYIVGLIDENEFFN